MKDEAEKTRECWEGNISDHEAVATTLLAVDWSFRLKTNGILWVGQCVAAGALTAEWTAMVVNSLTPSGNLIWCVSWVYYLVAWQLKIHSTWYHQRPYSFNFSVMGFQTDQHMFMATRHKHIYKRLYINWVQLPGFSPSGSHSISCT